MSCPGKRKNENRCGSVVYKCKHCQSVGCDHSKEEECSNQNFKSGKCLRCGKPGAKGSHL